MVLLKRIYPKEQSLEATIERPARRTVVGQGIRESTVYPVAVHINGIRLSLLEKVFDTPYSKPEMILHQHAIVKRLGLPTLPVVFSEEGTRSLYVTDLTRGGRNLCLSTMDWQSNGDRVGTRCADYRLFRLDNAPAVTRDFADMVLKATIQGVKFVHHDISFLIIEGNHQGKVICGDLGQVDPNPGQSPSTLRNYNWWAGRTFLSELNKHLDPLQLDTGLFDSRVKGAVL